MSFDEYSEDYAESVERAIAMGGAKHEFYLRAKIDALLACEPQLSCYGAQIRCLDFGCGTGLFQSQLEIVFPQVFGLDPSFGSLSKVARNFRGHVVQASGQNIPFSDETFDIVVVCCVLHHVPLEIRSIVVSECRRVLKRGGRIIVFEHNPWNPLTRLAVSRCEFDRDAVLLTAENCRKILSGQNFHAFKTRYFLFHPFRLPHIIMRLQNRLMHGVPFGAQYLCIATR